MAASRREIELFYREHYLGFRRGLVAITGSYESAHDVVQDAFVRAIAKRDQFRGDGPLGAWIWQIAIRIALDERARAAKLSFEDVLEGVLEDGFLEVTRDPELADALRALPPRRREIFFLRYFVDLSYQEIAAICGVSEGTVAAAISKARMSVVAALKEPELLRAGDARA